MKNRFGFTLLTLLLGLSVLAGCSSKPVAQTPAASTQNTSQNNPQVASSPSAVGSEQPIAAEQNPVGDIPDTQAFVPYTSSTAGYHMEVPEGWARTEQGKDVSFISKLDGVSVTVAPAAGTGSLSAKEVKADQAAQLKQLGRAVTLGEIKEVALPSGQTVLVSYTSNSEPDAVTGKQIRLENNSYLYTHNDRVYTLRLWAPQGADNVDQWQRISRSFGW